MIAWSKIRKARIEHGYNAASSLNATPFAVCRQCHNRKEKSNNHMIPRVGDDGSVGWYCIECGGTKTLQRKITTTNIKRMEGRVAAEIDILRRFGPVYRELQETFSATLKENDDFIEKLKVKFLRQESQSRKLSFHTPSAYFIQHHDTSTKGKKKRCYIKNNDILKIGVTDPAYTLGINSMIETHKPLDEMVGHWLDVCCRCMGRLVDLKFPREYAYEKIEHDMDMNMTWT